MTFVKRLFGTILAVVVPLLAYILTSASVAIAGFHLDWQPPSLVTTILSIVAAALVFWIMTKA